MAQAGAQREPSMEEILASIRKIIENNDGDRDQQVSAAQQVEIAEVEPEAPSSRVENEDAPADPQPPRPSAGNQEAAAGSVSLADIAARMRTDKHAPVGTVLDESAVRDLQDFLEDEKLDTDMPLSRKTGDELREVANAIAGMTPGLDTKSVDMPEEPEDDEAFEDSQSSSGAPAQGGHAISGLGQLMSVEAGEKVAHSFAQLDAAIAAGSQRSFDEIAEELLRPMLQTWLDDNLPTLVERLVREEIERVSRGTRR